ncbi:SDR family NAD(P)-dependent oxidoreductase [Streptomyces johnsoniae]|uniref:SDR family oxidoreductase n=1 Tax=Streptomyces johnsoniae TaxID=3075532 RepID=A0ABU2S309_9ACTN|nr:SDR family oxidoreductase [Streptomyces sp. DSM 41886]MDT0443086.1 SDR family oxidoreductase [Streptomyces sp. DSM 41886]
MDLRGTVAVITGGCTGIGRATTLALARAGAAGVVATYRRSAAEAAELVPEAEALGARALTERADVADDFAVRALAATALRHFGRVDILVNNAGTTRAVPEHDLDALTDADWHEALDVNVVGAFRCARAFAPALRAASGALVNIASVSGYRAGGSSLAYGTSKAALLQLTRNLAGALAPHVRVNAVAPGTVATRWQTGLHGAEGFAERARAERETVPLRATPGPEHVAQAVLGLLHMDLVTGEAVIVDGGKHIRY